VEAVFHDGDEFAVAQLTVAVLVKNLEHSVHQVSAQARACAQFHSAVKFVCKYGHMKHQSIFLGNIIDMSLNLIIGYLSKTVDG
jgi:hypothetical protein